MHLQNISTNDLPVQNAWADLVNFLQVEEPILPMDSLICQIKPILQMYHNVMRSFLRSVLFKVCTMHNRDPFDPLSPEWLSNYQQDIPNPLNPLPLALVPLSVIPLQLQTVWPRLPPHLPRTLVLL